MKQIMTWVATSLNIEENPILKMMDYKTGAALMALVVNIVAYVKNESILGVSATFLMLIVILMIVDWFTGIKASRHEGKAFESNKVVPTIIKFLTLFLWLWLSREMTSAYDEIPIADMTISFISTFVLILVTLREYVSIGENLERTYGSKHYIFHLVDDIFGMFEKTFKKKIKDEDNPE